MYLEYIFTYISNQATYVYTYDYCTFTLIFLITGTNYALAVQMVFSFKTPKELIQAAQATLVRKLKLDEKRAEKIHSFCRSLFQPDMTKRN